MAAKTMSLALRRLPAIVRYIPATALLILAAWLGYAEDAGVEVGPTGEADYYFETDALGNPSFTQRIRWQGDPNALRYEIVLYDADGTRIDRKTTPKDYVEFHLHPGDYGYVLTVYNLLEQAEFESDLIEFTVKRAEIPRIATIKPAAIYRDEDKPTVITIEGELIMMGAEVTLVDQSKGKKRRDVVGNIREHEDEKTAVVEFPRDELQYGYYVVRIRNPGGLATEAEKPLKVRNQKPLDFFASMEYSPAFPLYDSCYTENWSDTFYPLGAGARIGCYFLKRRIGYFGAEIHGTIGVMGGGDPEATLETFLTSGGLDVLYAFRGGSAFRLAFRLGGGLSRAEMGFDYEGTKGASMETCDPYAMAGASAQWFFLKHLYAEAGIDWMNVFRKDYVEGLVSPILSIGCYF